MGFITDILEPIFRRTSTTTGGKTTSTPSLFDIIFRGATGIASLIGGSRAASQGAGATRRLQNLLTGQVNIGQQLLEETGPLRKASGTALLDIVEGRRPPIMDRILGPRESTLSRGFESARENIRSRIPSGGHQEKLLAKSFEEEATARANLESGAAQQALTQGAGIGFRTPTTSISAMGSAGSGFANIAAQAAARQRAAGQAFGALLAQK